MSFEMPQMQPEKNERYFNWNGKKFEHDEDYDVFSINKKELSEIEIEAFRKDLKKQFPDVDYVLVSQPYIEGENYVFEKVEKEEDEEKEPEKIHDPWHDDLPHAA